MNKHIHSDGQGDGTVGKALDVLDQVAGFGRPVRFSDLLAQSPHPKATLYRLLQTLTNQQMLSHDPETGSYSLGGRLMRLAHQGWKSASLAPVARPFVEALAEKVGETVHLAQIDSGQVLFVDKLQVPGRAETLAEVGKVAPAYCTGVGKAMLAFMAPMRLQLALRQQAYFPYTATTHQSADSLSLELDQIRDDGIAYDREEHQQGIVSIAAPVLNANGRVIGALSIASTTDRHTPETLAGFRDNLITATSGIGAEATSWHFPS